MNEVTRQKCQFKLLEIFVLNICRHANLKVTISPVVQAVEAFIRVSLFDLIPVASRSGAQRIEIFVILFIASMKTNIPEPLDSILLGPYPD